ncbi:hypothetical protein JTB14_013615 [Gonioctena quinquepunctata]|nr:hypothetical protein JTB14_013615 [Gonioctena quinquepunctata]
MVDNGRNWGPSEVKRLYLCGGDTTHKAVFPSMKKLLSREVALLHSGTEAVLRTPPIRKLISPYRCTWQALQTEKADEKTDSWTNNENCLIH